MKTQFLLTRALALLSLGAIFFSHLALTDIAHGEPDPRMEWLVLQLSAGILLIFIVFAWLTLGRLKRALGRNA